MSKIAASWVISPVLGGVIAAAFLAFIKAKIIYQDDKIAAARRWVPVLVGIMAGAFATYLALKGLKKIVKIDLEIALLIGATVGGLSYVITAPLIKRQSEGMENRNKSLKALFALPLVISATLLSFAHGANDVANAVGPLAAIVHTAQFGDIAAKVTIPTWVMVIGAFGISFGLFLMFKHEERRRRKLVRRSHFMTIVAAWVITVPAAALLSGCVFLVLSAIAL